MLLNPFIARYNLSKGVKMFCLPLCSFYENSVEMRDEEEHCNPLLFLSVYVYAGGGWSG